MNTRNQLIESTSQLIKNKGYFGTAINEILSSTSVPKGSLYHHFPKGKDELIGEALKMVASQYAEEFKKAMKGKNTASDGLKAVVDLYILRSQKSGSFNACPLASVALDVSNQNENLREICESLFNFWTEATYQYLIYKGETEARRKATSFLIRLEGAILLSTVQKSIKPFELIKEEIEELLKN